MKISMPCDGFGGGGGDDVWMTRSPTWALPGASLSHLHLFLTLLLALCLQSNWDEVVDNFDDMNLREELLRGIYAYGFEKPSAIQQRAIVPCIKGEMTSPSVAPLERT